MAPQKQHDNNAAWAERVAMEKRAAVYTNCVLTSSPRPQRAGYPKPFAPLGQPPPALLPLMAQAHGFDFRPFGEQVATRQTSPWGAKAAGGRGKERAKAGMRDSESGETLPTIRMQYDNLSGSNITPIARFAYPRVFLGQGEPATYSEYWPARQRRGDLPTIGFQAPDRKQQRAGTAPAAPPAAEEEQRFVTRAPYHESQGLQIFESMPLQGETGYFSPRNWVDEARRSGWAWV